MGLVLGRLLLFILPFAIGLGIGALVRYVVQKKEGPQQLYPGYALGASLTLVVFGIALFADSSSSPSAKVGKWIFFLGLLALIVSICLLIWWFP